MRGTRFGYLGLACLAAFLLMSSVAGAAATIKVTTTSDSGASDGGNCLTQDSSCSLRQALAKAPSGDTVSVPAGTYKLTQAGQPLSISTDITVTGAGARSTTIEQTEANTTVLEITQSATVQGVTITGGTAAGGSSVGGGIYTDGSDVTLEDSTVRGNTALGSLYTPPGGSSYAEPAYGGGVYVGYGSFTLLDSTVSNNQASPGPGAGAYGGGIADYDSGLTIVNSTVADNGANGGSGPSGGGGIYLKGGTPITLDLASSTVADNTVSASAGQPAEGGNIGSEFAGMNTAVKNTIIADGSAASGSENCAGTTLTSQGYNLESTDQCGFTGTGDQVNIDPELGELENNGGPSETMALLTGSPAINAGNPAGCTDFSGNPLTTDQRGVTRPQGPRCDIGAFEAAVPAFSRGPEVAGKPRVGQTLACTFTLDSSDVNATTQVMWLRGTTQVGAGSHYTVKPADAGHSLRCRVLAKGPGGQASKASSAVAIPFVPSVSIKSAAVTGHTAKFKFTTGHATGAQCALTKSSGQPHYSACTSPKTYKNLAKGSYTFYVRAVGPGGTSAPAKHAIGVAAQ